MSKAYTENDLNTRAHAYNQIQTSADYLLGEDSLYWTEKLLLSLVARMSRTRLSEMVRTLLGEQGEMNAAQREAAIEAAAAGHSLGQWEEVGEGWRASCVLCQGTTWVEFDGLRYSLLADSCSNATMEE